jgi:hypothetical protein
VNRASIAFAFDYKRPKKRGAMPMRVISLLLILSLLTTSSSAAVGQESQQAVTKMRQIAMKAVDKGKAVTVTLKTARTDKKKYTGMLSNVSEQGFTLVESGSGQQRQFDFDEIQGIRMKGSHVGLVVGLVAAGVAAIVVLLGLRHELNKS